MRPLDNQAFAKSVLASIILIATIKLFGLALHIHDIFYLKKIIAGREVSEFAHTFFLKKNEIESWTSTSAHLIFLIAFCVWLFRAYKNVYIRETQQAPYRPGIVPFSYIIPFFNLYAPYQIMRFIWWGNATSVEHLNKGYKAIKAWWFIALINYIIPRILTGVYQDITHADDYLSLTYWNIFIYLINFHYLFLTFKLVFSIHQSESNQS